MTIQTHTNNLYIFEKQQKFQLRRKRRYLLKTAKKCYKKIILLDIALKNKIN